MRSICCPNCNASYIESDGAQKCSLCGWSESKELLLFNAWAKGKKIIENKNIEGKYIPIQLSLIGMLGNILNAKKVVDVRSYAPYLTGLTINFTEAKKAFIAGDLETVGKFFNLYKGHE